MHLIRCGKMATSNQLRQEVLQMYREILRTARVFRGQLDGQCEDYCRVICTSARTELNNARKLTSQEEIMRRIVTARAALENVQRKVRGLQKNVNNIMIMEMKECLC